MFTLAIPKTRILSPDYVNIKENKKKYYAEIFSFNFSANFSMNANVSK